MGTGAGTTGQEDSYYNRGGGSSGDQSGGAATGGGATGGGGEAGTVSFCYEVYSGSKALIAESGYVYFTREDARDAGMKLAEYPGYVIVKPDKAGFNTSRYDAVPATEPGVEVTTGPGGTTYTGTGNKPATEPGGAYGGDSGGLPGPDSNWMMYLVIAIVIIAIIAIGLKGGS